MGYEDFFDKNGSDEPFRPRNFERTAFTPPQMSDDVPVQSGRSAVSAFFAGLTSVILLSFTEGTLVWVIFESLEDLGALDERLPWHPFVVIAFAVNLIRVFDKAMFGRK